jgi:hypothetical protein
MPSKLRKLQASYQVSDRSPVVYLADLIRAFETLAPQDDATRQAIAEMLGFEWTAVRAAVASAVSPEESRSAAGQRADRGSQRKADESSTAVNSSPTLRSDWLPSQLSQAAVDHQALEVEVKQPEAVLPEDQAYLLPPFEPLFRPNATRGILSAAVATESGDGPIDLELLVDRIARRAHLDEIPREPVPTLRRGLQLLVDMSEALMPFSRDQDWLRATLEKLVPADRLEMLFFAGCPGRGAGTGLRSEWTGYRYPSRPGTVILLLTDLGIGRPLFSTERADAAEWREFALGARRAGCPLVALTPYASQRWPAGLEDVMKIIEWDRRTNATRVRMVIGIGHQVSR